MSQIILSMTSILDFCDSSGKGMRFHLCAFQNVLNSTGPLGPS